MKIKQLARPLLVFALAAAISVAVHFPGRKDAGTVAYGSNGDTEDIPFSTDDVRLLFEQAAAFSVAQGGLFTVLDDGGNHLGWLIAGPPDDADVAGFAGRVPFLIGLDRQRRVTGVQMLPSRETPGYARRVDEILRDAWNGLLPAAAAGVAVDAVSGATGTSLALIEGVRLSLLPVAAMGADGLTPLGESPGITVMLPSVLVAAFLLVALVVFMRRGTGKRTRYVLKVAAVIVPGLLCASLLSLPWFAALLRGHVSLDAHGILLGVTLAALLIPVVTGRNFYCHFYCPYGAAQDCAGWFVRRKPRFGQRLVRVFKPVRLGLLVTAITVVVSGSAFDLAVLEPFASFRWHHAPLISRVLAAGFLALAIWVPRPWCRMCPTGGIIEALRRRTLRTGANHD